MTDLPIVLPPGFTPLVSHGESVTVEQILAEKKATSQEATINIASELSLPVQKVAKTIRKNPGDTIEPGDVIAQKSGFLGMGKQKVMSSISGTIASYDRRTGDMTIRLHGVSDESENETILSPVAGRVVVCNNEKIVIQVEKEGIAPILGIGGTIQAKLLHLAYDDTGSLPLHFLTTNCIGKVILTRELDREGVLKAVGIGVGGAIVEMLSEKDATYLNDKGYSFPILQISAEEFRDLVKWNGKTVYLDGDKKSVVTLETKHEKSAD